MSSFLVFENVVKRFGSVTAVDNVSLTVERGEIFSLLGQFGEISAVPQITFRVLAWTAEFAGRIPSLAKDSPNR